MLATPQQRLLVILPQPTIFPKIQQRRMHKVAMKESRQKKKKG